ncbi:succinyl-CoA synthetase-like protein [Dactylonectria macrodidyma]|uniref:Succinyl-CoA synthetase-like protein n=1 Tax=Dactylonectria macrodidyma TaxID=307937 RepID=A0A9P9IF17_9HYPO|nr:succinyl-CoA synthetase-like protein [Dactylonectria macrodidyma]
MASTKFAPRLWRQGFGIAVPRGQVARTPAEVGRIIDQLGRPCVVKTQAVGQGAGKATSENGPTSAQVAQNGSAGEALAPDMLLHHLQSAPTITRDDAIAGFYVAESIQFDETWYLAMTLDRENYTPVVIVSRARNGASGGHNTFKLGLDEGITPDLLSRISKFAGASLNEEQNLRDILVRLHKLFVTKEATSLEINQLALGSDGTFTCLNANLSFDDASEKRQPELFALRDTKAEVPEELEAEKYGLVYIKMDGDIGNVVNGAGLAMATNDAIALYGGRSLNFLDAGGQATKQTIQKAFEIILRDKQVKVILVNIYGGIIKCDMIAESIIGAAQELGSLRVPLVVRLQGTNSAEGLKILEDADLGFHVRSDFGKAAETAVQLSKSARVGTTTSTPLLGQVEWMDHF